MGNQPVLPSQKASSGRLDGTWPNLGGLSRCRYMPSRWHSFPFSSYFVRVNIECILTYFAKFYTAMGNNEKATLLKQNFLDYM